ncbi:TIGR00341 family protein [Pengzhenrongella frigida]|uniref:TIGR00341 family protein n=1 Tax=Pengzhenrongella frigida TaxID=1259133 RepID=A0A4Q5N2A7_9MICO|nr:TIGR00341 family protein [Cellulomonas sp. HLT2-17]RYV52308.1 TIGR00341 family protein [Cellulomonas sp. HLT2-17]
MRSRLSQQLLPEVQRRTLDELTADLDLTAGDADSKRSAFWTMLVVSAVIAAAGVMSDSTATVIGAMIIAPLSTPIMGIALGVVLRDSRLTGRAVRFVVLGAGLVVLLGVLFTFIAPGEVNLFTNPQITGRTSPGLLDLVAAVATGVAGAVALTRRDVAAVLPGVAIAISLVPPLVVVGVCLGQGSIILATGALVLFLSNFVALVLVGMLVFTAAGYAAEGSVTKALSQRRAYLAIGTLLVLVLVPLVANTVLAYFVAIWSDRVQVTAEEWISAAPGSRVDGVDLVSGTFYVQVRSPGDLPDLDDLMSDLRGQVPDGLTVVVTTLRGEDLDAAVVGAAVGD